VLATLGLAYPSALSSCRGLVRAAAAKGDKALLQAFASVAAVVFDEYSQWRLESGRDIEHGPSEAMPCEPLVRLLLEALPQSGDDPKEFLLGQVRAT
jgi:hypothetical protein